MSSKIRLHDNVVVLSGKEKGKIGRVKLIISKKNRVIVEGINFIKKHKKAVPSQNQVSEIIKTEASIHISNVAFLNPNTKKADRIGFRFESGKKVRFLKSNNETIR